MQTNTEIAFADAPIEIIDGDRSKAYPSGDDFSADGYCLFLNAGNVTVNGFDFSERAFVTERKDAELRKGRLRRHDLVLTTRGTVGNVAYFNESVPYEHIRINSGMVILRADHTRLDSRYLYYVVRSEDFRNKVNALRTGSAQPQLPIRDINRITLYLPTLKRQREIAAILGILDDKIETNRRISATLEAMAEALFTAWFVAFEPIKGDSGRQTGPALKAPALESNGLRHLNSNAVPDGWSLRGLDEIASFLNGLAMQRFPPVEGGPSLPVIKIAQLRAGNTSGADRADAGLKSDYVIGNGDILFSWSGSLECRIWTGGQGALNQHLFKVSGRTVPDWFAYLAVRHHLSEFRQIAADKATTMGHIQRSHLSAAKIAVAPDSLLQAAGSVIGPIIEASWKRGLESSTLARIRDSLLPKLMAGQLGIHEAEYVRSKSA